MSRLLSTSKHTKELIVASSSYHGTKNAKPKENSRQPMKLLGNYKGKHILRCILETITNPTDTVLTNACRRIQPTQY